MLLVARRRVAIVGLAAVLCGVRMAGAQAPNDEAIVKSFFPQWLTDESTKDYNAGGPPPFEASASATGDLDGSGRAFIVAAYTNGASAAVKVLQRQGASAVELAAPEFPLMLGIEPSVELLDLDHDRRPEVIVSFSSFQGAHADWVLRWDGTTLKLIGPQEVDEYGDAGTLLQDALFIDLDGDGVLEIVNTPEDVDPAAGPQPLVHDVYSLVNGKYVPSTGLLFFDTFARPPKPATDVKGSQAQDAEPNVVTRTFLMDAPGAYEMIIVNGDDDGTHKVTSAEIELNGVLVASPQTLGGNRRVTTVPVTVEESNTVRALLRGPRQTWLTIAIRPSPAAK